MWKLSKEDFEKWELEHFTTIHTNILQWKSESFTLLEWLEKEKNLFEQITNNKLLNN